jgi:cell filamentation protein
MTDRYDTSHFPEDQYEPGSGGTVLRNLLGVTSKEELEQVEDVRFERLMEEAVARFDRNHRFIAADILWLHQFWLEDVPPGPALIAASTSAKMASCSPQPPMYRN